MSSQAGWRVEDAPAEEESYELPAEFSLTANERQLLELLMETQLEAAQQHESTRKRLAQLLRALCEQQGLLLGKASAERVVTVAERCLCGYGVLDPLLGDPELEEIAVTGVGERVRVYHREKGWLATSAVIESEGHALHLINKMARPLGRRVSYQFPRLNATLPDGSRLHASIAPLAAKGVEMTVRKFTPRPFSPAELVANNTAGARCMALLWLALECDSSLLIAGNTGSGKTSTLNALFSFVPLGERVVVTEETPELRLPHQHLVRLVANEELSIGLKDLAKDTLRMRPDRVVIGEARTGEEVEALVDSLLAGQARGTYATFHADSAREALLRLRSLGAAKEDLAALNLILVQRRMSLPSKGARKSAEIRRFTELAEVTETGEARTLMELDRSSGGMRERGIAGSALLSHIAESHRCTRAAALKELGKRERLLREMAARKLKPGLDEFVAEIQPVGKSAS